MWGREWATESFPEYPKTPPNHLHRDTIPHAEDVERDAPPPPPPHPPQVEEAKKAAGVASHIRRYLAIGILAVCGPR